MYKNPEKNIIKVMDWVDKFAGDDFVPSRRAVRDALTDPENPYHNYILHIINDIDPHITKPQA